MAASDALIGWTGFVGGNLARWRRFPARYRSTDIDGIRGQHHDLVVCAGAPAAKWLANQDPEADAAGIARLTSALSEARAERFVLISTVDVFPRPLSVNEGSDPAQGGPNHAYGRHRLALEEFVRARFPQSLILRLPALFGPGLRKNALYDLLHRHRCEFIDPASAFQWYDLGRLGEDIERALAADLRLLHLAVEPLPTAAILDAVFPDRQVAAPSADPARYDLRTVYAGLFGGAGDYIESRERCLERIQAWVRSEGMR